MNVVSLNGEALWDSPGNSLQIVDDRSDIFEDCLAGPFFGHLHDKICCSDLLKEKLQSDEGPWLFIVESSR